MYYLQAEASFDAAHFLKGYMGKCRNIHGHRWRIVAVIQGETLQNAGSQAGMLRDFGDLKSDLKALADDLDHALILEKDSLRPETFQALEAEGFRMVVLPFRTTAENFSRFFYDQLTAQGYPVAEVSVYETPTNCARYTGEKEAPRVALL
jgi:6-pyruvoyltetrahydropterin/6-carboxytetrahydropterin synthase